MKTIVGLLLLLFSTTAHAETAYVYLGHLDGDAITEPTFVGIPAIKTSAEKTSDTTLEKPVTITCKSGITLRKDHSKSGESVGRLTSGTQVPLVEVHNGHGWVWGKVDLANVKVLSAAARLQAYARDGFAGRSGFGPVAKKDPTPPAAPPKPPKRPPPALPLT